MKIIALQGSPKPNGNTATALKMMLDILISKKIAVETIEIGKETIAPCIGCNACFETDEHYCVFNDDIVNEVSKKMRVADGFVLSSPTYFGGMTGSIKCLLDRIFYSSSDYFRYKVGTVLAAVRRTGGLSTFYGLKHYLDLSEMIMPPAQSWPIVYGDEPGEMITDAEGIQTIKRHAESMVWLLKVIDNGNRKFPIPETEKRIYTNFIK